MIKNITAHMIVHNEEQWVWYGLQSILPYVDKIIVYDTGSTDNSVEIIKSIKSSKIEFSQKGKVSAAQLIELRNEQIKNTTTNWFMLLDGDEIWPEDTIKELKRVLSSTKKDAIVLRAVLPVGDLTHFQPDSAGRYRLLGKVGHYNIRAYRKMENHSWHGVYPNEAYIDKIGIPIQKKDSQLLLLKNPYWHMRLLTRSKKRRGKLEIGVKKRIKMPSVFIQERPRIVPLPLVKFTLLQYMFAFIITPLLRLKRRLKW